MDQPKGVLGAKQVVNVSRPALGTRREQTRQESLKSVKDGRVGTVLRV